MEKEKAKGGWSRKNLLIGAMFIVAGYVLLAYYFIAAYNSIILESSSSFWIFALAFFGFGLVTFGILGFWFIIPAFQKWWHKKIGFLYYVSYSDSYLYIHCSGLSLEALNFFLLLLSSQY